MAKRILLKSKDGWMTVVQRHRRRRQDSNPSKRWTPRGRRASPLSASFRRFHRKDSNEAKWRPVKPKYLPPILSLLPIPVPQAINPLPERRRTCQKLIGTKPSTLQKSKSHFTCLIPFPPPIDSKLKVMTGINTNPQPTGTNPNSYAQVAARPPPPPRNFHHQQPPQRFPPWQYYLDLNPWNCTSPLRRVQQLSALNLHNPSPSLQTQITTNGKAGAIIALKLVMTKMIVRALIECVLSVGKRGIKHTHAQLRS